MPRRTSLDDAARVEIADDLEEVVTDKRAGWRANAAKARRRQRRYKKKLIGELVQRARDPEADWDDED